MTSVANSRSMPYLTSIGRDRRAVGELQALLQRVGPLGEVGVVLAEAGREVGCDLELGAVDLGVADQRTGEQALHVPAPAVVGALWVPRVTVGRRGELQRAAGLGRWVDDRASGGVVATRSTSSRLLPSLLLPPQAESTNVTLAATAIAARAFFLVFIEASPLRAYCAWRSSGSAAPCGPGWPPVPRGVMRRVGRKLESFDGSSSSGLRVEGVAQTVAQQVERQHGDEDRETREEEIGRVDHEVLAGVRQHLAP